MSDDEKSPSSESSSNAQTSSEQSSSSSTAKKRLDLAAYKERFNKLHKQREEGRKLNHDQVVEEDRTLNLPRNHEAKQRRKEWELEELEGRKKAEELGEDYDRYKSLNIQADIAERNEAAKRRKKRTDPGFASYEQMSIRQYERLTNNLKPDMETYKKMKTVIGEEEFYPSANTLIQGSHYPTESAMNKLTTNIDEQAKRRQQFHRRRTFDPDAPITFINEKNRKFNEKLELTFRDIFHCNRLLMSLELHQGSPVGLCFYLFRRWPASR